MASLLPYQVLNLAAAPSPDSQPSPNAKVTVHSTRRPAPDDDKLDLSAESPTRAAGLARITVSELGFGGRFGGKVRRFVRANLARQRRTLDATRTYLLIVVIATGAAVAFGSTPSVNGNVTACVAVFAIVLAAGVWGNKRLK